MKRNLLALVLILAVCAVVARYRQLQEQARLSLGEDLRVALEVLWGVKGQEVLVIPSDSGVEVRARVVFPRDTRSSRRAWCFPLLRFAARRHGPPAVREMRLTDAGTGQPLVPLTPSPLPDRPYAQPSSDEARAEIVRREAQGWLDSKLGAQRALALVDCESKTMDDFLPKYDTLQYNLMTAYVPPPKGWRKRNQTTVTLVIVLDGRATDPASLQKSLQELNRSPRIVVLP
jgi:hypothetical protein